MKIVEINRSRNNVDGIIGILSIDFIPFCLTLEQPWNDNIPFKSCVPSGIYICKQFESPKYGITFEIMDVPDGRDLCLFHWGNTVENTLGCVLLGNQIGTIYDKRAILNSKITIKNFLNRFEYDLEFPLLISDQATP